MPTKQQTQPPMMTACEAIRLLRPEVLDLDAIEALIGDRTVGTLREVAAEFGIRATTCKTNWRQAGCPGKRGDYNLAEILVWRLAYDAENRGESFD